MGNVAELGFYADDQRVRESRSGTSDDRDTTGRISIGEFARASGVTLRALRFYQSKGLLAPARDGAARHYSQADGDRLSIILQGKRLGFTLLEIREMLVARARGCDKVLPINREKCVEQINLLERQRRNIESALSELRQIYTGMFKTVLKGHGPSTVT